MDNVRPLFLSTYPPETCTVATFTKETADAIDLLAKQRICAVAAIQKNHPPADADRRIAHVIDNDQPNAYRLAAEFFNAGPYDLVSVQHEFSLYPEEWGCRLVEFIHTCDKPIVTTFHTLPTQPESRPRQLVQTFAAQSRAVVVLSEDELRLLTDVYGIPSTSVHMISLEASSLPFVGQKYLSLFNRVGASTSLHSAMSVM